MSINVSGYDGTIRNLTVLGNLTIGGSLPVLSYASNATQPIGINTETPINFGNAIYNTLTNCAISNTNSVFTYTGTTNTLWLITANCRTDNAITTAGGGFALWVRKNGAGPFYSETYVSTFGYATCSLNCSTMIPMATNDFISIEVFATGNISISANATYSASAVTIAQI